MRSEIYKIHYINKNANKYLSPIIYLASVIVVLLLLILPYKGRLTLALIINMFFNRPIIYLNYISKKIADPLNKMNVAIFYFLICGMFSAIYKIFVRKKASGFVEISTNSNTDLNQSKYQS